MTFEQFISSDLRSFHIEEPSSSSEQPFIRIYIRRTPKILKPLLGDYQLATLQAYPMGRGLLTRFLDQYESQYQFFIENVLDERLRQYFLRRGYYITQDYCIMASFLYPAEKIILANQTKI